MCNVRNCTQEQISTSGDAHILRICGGFQFKLISKFKTMRSTLCKLSEKRELAGTRGG